MRLADLPHFVIEEKRDVEAERHLFGRFTSTRGVREGRSWLYDADQSLIGDLEQLDIQSGRAVFRTPDWTPASRAQPGTALPWVEGYWQAYHLTMILDEKNAWRRTEFVPSPAQYFLLNGGRGWQPVGQQLPTGATPLEVVQGAWDHEHCELCRAKIGRGGAALGYVDPANRWLCDTCFRRYAEPCDLGFLAPH